MTYNLANLWETLIFVCSCWLTDSHYNLSGADSSTTTCFCWNLSRVCSNLKTITSQAPNKTASLTWLPQKIALTSLQINGSGSQKGIYYHLWTLALIAFLSSLAWSEWFLCMTLLSCPIGSSIPLLSPSQSLSVALSNHFFLSSDNCALPSANTKITLNQIFIARLTSNKHQYSIIMETFKSLN